MMMQGIKKFLEEDKEYFQSSRMEITTQNNHMLIRCCFTYAAVLLFYTLFTNLTNQPNVLRRMYYIFDVLHILLCIRVVCYTRKGKAEYYRVQWLCILLELSVLTFFILEGVFTSPTQHSLYIPIALLLILLLFIHKAFYTNMVSLLYVLTYAVLSVLYKTPEAYTNDLYIAIATFLASNIGYILIAEMRHREAAVLYKYEILSKTDQLTGLLNKTAIETLCKRMILDTSCICAFIILDLDNFKKINDVYGHAVGDEVLSMVAAELQKCFREADHVGRFGGDEFIILIKNCNNFDIITERVEKFAAQIRGLQFRNEDLNVSCSIGITMEQEHDDFQSMFRRADRALYKAKASGKGRYCIADTE